MDTAPKENLTSLLWNKYFPYWRLYLLLVVLAVGVVWYRLHFKLPVYECTAKLLIKDEKKGLEDSKMMESLNLLATKKIIENEIEVIKSRTLMAQVVKELKLYAPVFEKSKWKDLSAYASSPVKIEVQNPDSLVEANKVEFAYDASGGTVTVNGQTCALNQWITTPWGRLRFLANNKQYRYGSPLYFVLVHPKKIIQNLIGSLEVYSAGKLSTVLDLKIRDEVPERAEDILNTLIADYDKASVNDKNMLAENTLSFLDDRLRYVSTALDSVEKRLQQYKTKKAAINISSQGQLFLQNVSENDQKISDANMKLAVLGQVEQYIFSKDSRGGLVPSTLGVSDPLLTNLLNKLYDAELQYEKLKPTVGENNPELTSLAVQIEKIKPSILENVRSQQRSLEATKKNLYATNGTYTSLLQALPQQERDLVEINREQNIKSASYSFLLQKREEAALSRSSTVSDSRLVDKAESSLDPTGLGDKQVYVMGILVAIALGIVLVTVKEFFNPTIVFRQEIETLTSFPVIGEIVLDKSKTQLVLQESEDSLIAEEFRMLRTSLQYLGIGSGEKKILITSTISGEGKSFVAANLAMSLAISGKKVILVEFDLKNPTLASKLGMKSHKGVTDYLRGDADVDEVIKSTGDSPNLFLITAGNLSANPSELILHQRTADLFRCLESRFDYVLVDCAPVGLLSDGYVLSRHCNATLFVVRHKYTPKKMLERLEPNTRINELKNLAIVFNGIREYGYGYGYIYNQDQKRKKGAGKYYQG